MELSDDKELAKHIRKMDVLEESHSFEETTKRNSLQMSTNKQTLSNVPVVTLSWIPNRTLMDNFMGLPSATHMGLLLKLWSDIGNSSEFSWAYLALKWENLCRKLVSRGTTWNVPVMFTCSPHWQPIWIVCYLVVSKTEFHIGNRLEFGWACLGYNWANL